MGVTPTFTFNETTRHVDITDRRTNGAFLTVYPIDVVNAGSAPKVTSRFRVYIPAFYVQRNFAPTDISIQSTARVDLQSIYNPIGTTTITTPQSIQFDKITSHTLVLNAGDSVGIEITEYPNGGTPTTRRSTVELTSTSAGNPSFTVDANNLVTMSVVGLQRVPGTFQANVAGITGRRLNVDFNPAKLQTSGGDVGTVVVEKTQQGLINVFGQASVLTRFVNTVYNPPGTFNNDPAIKNTDVFGVGNGTQVSAVYRVADRIDATEPENSSIVAKPNAVIDYPHYREVATLPNNFSPGATQKWADINGDGKLDLVTASGSTLTVLINELGTNSNSFRVLRTIDNGQTINSFALGDLDQDGDVDLAFQRGARLNVWKNVSGDFPGTEIPLTYPVYSGIQVSGDTAIADVNGDGYADVIDSGDSAVAVHLFGSTGNIADKHSIFGHYTKLDVGDYDRDGDVDLLVGGNGQATKIFKNDGSGNFSDSGLLFPSTVAGPLQFGDSDGDGDLDVLVLSGAEWSDARTLTIAENNGGSFRVRSETTDTISNVLWLDQDADGDLDVLTHLTNRDRNVLLVNVGVASRPNDPLFITTGTRELPDGLTLQGFSSAILVGGRGADLLYTGQQNGQPFYKVFENFEPIFDVTPAAPTGLGSNTAGALASISWSSPAGTATAANPYSFNVRLRHGSEVLEVSTPAGRGAVNANTYQFTGLTVGELYYYSVQTVDVSGRRSAWSGENAFFANANLYVNLAGDFDDGLPTNNQTTLREAINISNSQAGRYRIQLLASPGTLSSPLTITKGVTIFADSPAQIIGNGSDRIFNIDDGTANNIDVQLSNSCSKADEPTSAARFARPRISR